MKTGTAMNAKVLIIEDEPSLANNLAAALARSGVSAVVAGSLAAASKNINVAEYALVCADIQLGDGSGLDFCEAMRRERPETPVIMMTGQDTAANRLRAEDLGAAAFIAKPFPLARFREMVAAMLRERSHGGGNADAPRILMYSHDTIGLGHMRRNSAIAARIVEQNPLASVLMLVGSPSGIPFALPPGVDYVKLPSLAKVGRDIWRPQSLRVSSEDVISLRSALIEQAVISFAPNLFLADHEPGGVSGELLPALRRLNKAGAHIVLGLRDILDEPQITRQSWRKRGTDRVIQSLYEQILVYGDEDVFPTQAAYGLTSLLPGKVFSCGYVTNSGILKPERASSRAKARIVVAGGGGRDAFPLMAAAVEALISLPPHERPDADIIAGPLMDAELRGPLEKSALDHDIRVLTTHPDVPSLLAEADLFVTMGGYNSIIEAAAIGCPTLVVPRVGPSAEQRLRAECMAERGAVEVIAASEASSKRLAQIFGNVRPNAGRMVSSLDLGGAERAAARICSLIEQDATRRVSQSSRRNHARAG